MVVAVVMVGVKVIMGVLAVDFVAQAHQDSSAQYTTTTASSS